METNPINSKSNDDNNKEGTVGFHSIPEKALLSVAGFAAPPDIYNLSLTSKRFHTASGGGKVLATRLLRASLLSNLDRVLQSTNTGITLEAALELSSINNPKGQEVPQVLIAGSTLAQACLGKLWSSTTSRSEGTDVDVYSSAAAAPLVRSWLVEKASSMFVGYNDYMIDLADSRLLYTVDTKIHHVEQFGSMHANAARKSEDPEEYKQSTTAWGQNCDWYINEKWSRMLVPLGLDGKDPAFRVRPKPGGEMPFDFDGDGNIDLIVASKKEIIQKNKDGNTANKKQKVNSVDVLPLEILEDFDLTICKASFDGRTFRIPDPHLTFQGMTTMEPVRKQIVQSYLQHLPGGGLFRLGAVDRIQAMRKVITAVQKDLKGLNTPMFHLVDRANYLLRGPSHFLELDEGDVFALYNPMVQATYGSFLQFHNWTAKLLNRLHKYQNRGIDVVEAPVIDDDQVLQQYNMT